MDFKWFLNYRFRGNIGASMVRNSSDEGAVPGGRVCYFAKLVSRNYFGTRPSPGTRFRRGALTVNGTEKPGHSDGRFAPKCTFRVVCSELTIDPLQTFVESSINILEALPAET